MSPIPDIGYHPARVLIVDDERHNRELLEVMLTPEGLLLELAATGEEALAMVAQQPPDLILLDIMMPGMDGYQVAAHIKGEVSTKNIPIIMVTALDDRDARVRGLSTGAEDFPRAWPTEEGVGKQWFLVSFLPFVNHQARPSASERDRPP